MSGPTTRVIQGVYLYASATGQVELFPPSTSLFFSPDGQWLRLPKWEDTPTYRDEYELVWLDETRQTHRLAVEGHTPRSHPQLFPVYLASRAQLVFSSSQGISLVSLPDGETLRFWELASNGICIASSPRLTGRRWWLSLMGTGCITFRCRRVNDVFLAKGEY